MIKVKNLFLSSLTSTEYLDYQRNVNANVEIFFGAPLSQKKLNEFTAKLIYADNHNVVAAAQKNPHFLFMNDDEYSASKLFCKIIEKNLSDPFIESSQSSLTLRVSVPSLLCAQIHTDGGTFNIHSESRFKKNILYFLTEGRAKLTVDAKIEKSDEITLRYPYLYLLDTLLNFSNFNSNADNKLNDSSLLEHLNNLVLTDDAQHELTQKQKIHKNKIGPLKSINKPNRKQKWMLLRLQKISINFLNITSISMLDQNLVMQQYNKITIDEFQNRIKTLHQLVLDKTLEMRDKSIDLQMQKHRD